MTRADSLAVVQFIHPGKEQTSVGANGVCAWNAATRSDKAWPHRRKFMAARASYTAGVGDASVNGVVGFWGEWEATSRARIIGRGEGGMPRFCHLPVYREPKEVSGLLDTDPFVFGDRFLYNGCQQHTNHHRVGGAAETFLRRLSVGSLVMFGSSVDGGFVLDTALVVGDFIDYANGDFAEIARVVPPEYIHISLKTQFGGNPTVDGFRLYLGATFGRRVGGMFSFTPCVALSAGSRGFVRPTITLPGIVTQGLTQGKKRTLMASTDDVRAVWSEVVRQVTVAGCSLAHSIPMTCAT